ncbi:MAG TPA: sigma-54 dependent transcriptional regulator [Candidatus Sulfotelmatobacter sp.]|nr:sigma-54 dependent transcriptional regulator [Candidatus Sulfotelmatobacter sp.]
MGPTESNDRRQSASERYSIAIITLEEEMFREMRRALAPSFRATLASTESQIKMLIDDPDIHGIVLDLESIGEEPADGIEVLQEMRRLRDDLIMVAITDSSSSELPLLASQAGADHFFGKPVDCEQLRTLLLQTAEKRALQFEGQWLLDQVENKAAFCGLIGGSETMRKVYQAVEAVANSNASVVIRGESGVGKELVARAIVETGERRDQPYVCLNCSALPETLMESELFGYERGAFTGAEAAKPGMIELAHRGTLFLDEITTLDHGLQSKLLRVLQERSVQRLGGRTAKKIDFRLITATNDDLEDMVRKGRFREDLYYRINVVPIMVPPLRERKGDVALLVEHFVRLYCTANKKPAKQVQPDAMEILEQYSWPGNVRELENVVQRMVLMSDGLGITAHHLPQQLLVSSAASQEAILIPEQGVDFDAEMERIEIAYLNAALRRTNGKKSAAASLLRIDSQRMKYLCRKLNL